MPERVQDTWDSASPYERYVGRWSRDVAREFLAWLRLPPSQAWGDVGCGTGAVVDTILTLAEPASVRAIDRSEALLAEAQRTITDERVRFELAEATALPWPSASCDVTVSGLVLNFVPDAAAVLREMVRVTRPKGRVAAYVWDYGGGMQMMRRFWDAALEVSPEDAALDQTERFPLCQPKPLKTLFADAGLTSVGVHAIEIATVFRDFDDYWTPFLGKQGAAPTYLAALDSARRERIREVLRARLVSRADGTIPLTARAWTVQGTV
jgi:SAM-dependent methyltransferase